MPTSSCVQTAVILAAGTGSRLSPLTHTTHKCLTEVNGTPILHRQVSSLERWGFEHLIIVVGHRSQQVRQYLARCGTKLQITYVFNPRYQTTNNIYSLWLARKAIKRPFLLLESDVFFESSLLEQMRYPDRIATAKQQLDMNGTTVTLDDTQRVKAFHLGKGAQAPPYAQKTVNIYSLSLMTWSRMRQGLDEYISSGVVNSYYETVFRDMSADGSFNPLAVSFDEGNWYEIDTLADLHLAQRLFAPGTQAPPQPASESLLPLARQYG